MDGPRDYHTQWSKSDKDKYHVISLIYGILKHVTNELIYKTETDSNFKTDMVTKVERWRGKDKLVVWDWHMHTTMFKIDK